MDVKTDFQIFSFTYFIYYCCCCFVLLVWWKGGHHGWLYQGRPSSYSPTSYGLAAILIHVQIVSCPSPYPCPHPQLHTSSFLWDLKSSLKQAFSSQLLVPYQQILVYSSIGIVTKQCCEFNICENTKINTVYFYFSTTPKT